MRHLRASTWIDAPPQRVWDLYADVEGSVAWVSFAEEILYVSGPAGPGQVYRERTRLGGISDVAEWTVIEWDPPRRQVQQSLGKGMDSRLVIAVAAEDGGTRARQEVILRSRAPGPLGWLHERLFGVVARRGIEGALHAAKKTLESSRAPGEGGG